MCPLPIGAHTAGCCSGIHSGNSGFGTGPWGSSCGGFPFAPLVQGRRSDGLRAAAAAGGGTVAAAAGGGTVADRNAPRGWLAGTAQRSLEAGGIAHCSLAAAVAVAASTAGVAGSSLPGRLRRP